MVTLEMNGANYILLMIYGYNSKVQNKLSFIFEQVVLDKCKVIFTVEKIVMKGDFFFYLAPDLWLDHSPSMAQCHNYDETIFELVANSWWSDYWRMKNSIIRQYTWFDASENGQCSRSDYWLTWKWEISASLLTDHCVALDLYLCRYKSILYPVWRFNNILLGNIPFCKEVKQMFDQTIDMEKPFLSRCEWFKFEQVAIKTSKHILNWEKQEQKDIIRDINELCFKT